MARPRWDDLDTKVLEADFFLERMEEAGLDFFAVRCFFNAFVAAARSITFIVQAQLKHEPGFEEWYAAWQARLRADSLAQYFVRARNETQKIGAVPVQSGSSRWNPNGPPSTKYFFGSGDGAPSSDVVSSCKQYLIALIELVLDRYTVFGPAVERPSFFSVSNLSRIGLSVEDIEEALGYPKGWTAGAGLTNDERLALLKNQVPESLIGRVFEKYLGRGLPDLDERH